MILINAFSSEYVRLFILVTGLNPPQRRGKTQSLDVPRTAKFKLPSAGR